MKNAFLRAGYTCVSMMIAAGLMSAAQAPVMVTLPHAVTVGSTVLPSGDYTISAVEISTGEYFVVRSAHGPTVTLQAQKVVSTEESANTEVVFSRDGDTWHFDKMFIQGQDASYQFASVK